MIKGDRNENQLETQAYYLYGRYERELEFISATHNFTAGSLTTRVGSLLLGVGSGSSNNLPNMQRKATKTTKILKPKMEVVSRSRGSQTSKISSWWNKNFPTKKARSAEVKRRLNLNKEK